jgi:hypothetical protein
VSLLANWTRWPGTQPTPFQPHDPYRPVTVRSGHGMRGPDGPWPATPAGWARVASRAGGGEVPRKSWTPAHPGQSAPGGGHRTGRGQPPHPPQEGHLPHRQNPQLLEPGGIINPTGQRKRPHLDGSAVTNLPWPGPSNREKPLLEGLSHAALVIHRIYRRLPLSMSAHAGCDQGMTKITKHDRFHQKD